jgi:hypothetical protein
MCLDIDPDSVIHKHLVKKVTDLTTKWDQGSENPLLIWKGQDPDCDKSHGLTMLDSFHISLGTPKKDLVDIDVKKINSMLSSKTDLVQTIGEITLAPICISSKNNKKSAWIALDFGRIIHPRISLEHATDLNLSNFGTCGLGFDLYKSDGTPFHRFHISLANLTGNPHDSIARPEDCIIDTITA